MLRKSSNNHINHILKNPNNIIYVSCLLQRELFIHQNFCNKKETQTIKSIITKNKPHHIVGVHALCSCNFANISDFSQVAVFSRMVLPAFNFFRIFIYKGYNIKVMINAAKVKLNIKFKFCNIISNRE